MYYKLAIGLIVLVVLSVFVIQWIFKLRSMATGTEPSGLQDEISEFERMRNDGQISEEEFQRMKRIVAKKVIEQVRNSGKS